MSWTKCWAGVGFLDLVGGGMSGLVFGFVRFGVEFGWSDPFVVVCRHSLVWSCCTGSDYGFVSVVCYSLPSVLVSSASLSRRRPG